ncbi:MAG: 1-(5-phosphoribosyl)-5-[(5-phosphoribosylamino)methylideneamino]imidazole-4-carboxamide isomerase [Candidatus Merdivicinus sp.]|jgi:phosphoribosylformimino-5-aminoimidazole carboxamide ribotide isomerase
MIIFPAIDIKDGNCVRLYKGEFSTVHKVAENPLETARKFEADGAEWLHMVDLDGAKDAKPQNTEIFCEIARKTSLKVEVGGGIRTMETVESYLSKGISRVILGSVAVRNPELVKMAVKEYGDKIAVGIDAKNGMAAVEGWLDTSEAYYLDLARAMEQAGVSTIIYTDISKDGTLSGPNLRELEAINQAVSCNIVASGGISNLDDIIALRKLGLYGAICGKSLYQGTLDLKEAIREAGEVQKC